MVSETDSRFARRALDLLLALLILALGMLLLAVAQARLRQIGEDALARTLVAAWLAARAEEWAASPYGSPFNFPSEQLPALIAEAGLRAARPLFALYHRVCLELSCRERASFRAVAADEARRWGELPQWEEAVFGLEVELPSGRKEQLAVRLHRSPLTVGAAKRVASAAILRSE